MNSITENRAFNAISVDVIIVNDNSTDYLLKCLESIYKYAESLTVHVYVQDNDSSDDVDQICSRYPDVRLTKNSCNIGFSAAANRAMRQGASPYLVIVNPDTYFNKHFFQSTLHYMVNNPDVGVLGPKIFSRDGSIQGSARKFPNPVSGFFGRNSLLTRLFPNNIFTRKFILTQRSKMTYPIEVDWVSGACMVVRRKAIEKTGMLDERFFVYWEDVDWCRRMWMNGWKVVYYPAVSIVHYVGGSSDGKRYRSRLEFHKSCYRYFVKYPGGWPMIFVKPGMMLGLSIRFWAVLLHDFFLFSFSSSSRSRPKILFFIPEDWYFWSHRLPLARAVRDAGFEVLILTRVHEHGERILNEGFKLIPINLQRRSKNIVKEIYYLIKIIHIYRKERPDIVHHVTVKPILYGSWAAICTSISAVVNALAGLGSIYVTKGKRASFLRKIIAYDYRLVLSPKNSVAIFQNPEDLNLFVRSGIISHKKTVLIKGSGVDTNKFPYIPEQTGIPIVVLASRLLWDKGVGEFVDAAGQIAAEGIKCRFVLVGKPDPENPSSIPENVIRDWETRNIVEWWGHRNDIHEVFAGSNIVVLPSYREGLPKVLLEAASCGRAIVTTDVPGCREIVRNNENGLLVPAYDSKALAEAIKTLIKNPELRAKMGTLSRKIVEAEFSQEIVVKKTMEVYNKLLINEGFPKIYDNAFMIT